MTATNTKEQIIKAMRGAIPSRGSNELLNLTADQLWQLFLKLRAGESTASIARWLHSSLNSGRPIDSWNTSLKRFKKRIAHILGALPLAAPVHSFTAGRTMLPRVPAYDSAPTNDLERLEVQIRDYHELINKLTREANETGIVSKDLSKHQQAMASLVKAKLKLEESARSRPPESEISPERQAKLQGKWSKFCGMIDVDRMEALLDQLLLLAEPLMQTLEVHSDGSYKIRPRTESERIKDLALGICGGLSVKPAADVEEL